MTATETRHRTPRRSPALASRLLVGAAATAATLAIVGWMARAEAQPEAAGSATIRRRVVVTPPPEPVPYITLEAVLPGHTVTVITQPARVVHRAPAATAAAPPVVTTSSGS